MCVHDRLVVSVYLNAGLIVYARRSNSSVRRVTSAVAFVIVLGALLVFAGWTLGPRPAELSRQGILAIGG